MRRITVISTVLFFVLTCVASAKGPVKCDFEAELGKIYGDAEAKRVILAVQQSEILTKMSRMVDKLPDSGSDRPIIEQFSKEDAVEFERLRERQLILMNTSLSESKRMRDMQLFRKLVILAEKDVKWSEIPSSDHPDFNAYVALNLARGILKDKVSIEQKTKFDQCNLEAAIHVLEQEVVEKVEKLDLAPVRDMNSLVERLLKKYKMKSLDLNKLSNTDKRDFSAALENVQPIYRLHDLVCDYEIIKALAKASEFIYDFDKNDILTYGADADKIGTTIMNKANAGEFGDIFKDAHAILRAIDKQMPCEDAKNIMKMAEQAKEIKSKGVVEKQKN